MLLGGQLAVAMSMSVGCLQLAGRAGKEPQEHGEVFAEVWWWRELMQRLMDGCATTDHMLAAGLSAYEELPGPNVPVTSGYQVQYLCNFQQLPGAASMPHPDRVLAYGRASDSQLMLQCFLLAGTRYGMQDSVTVGYSSKLGHKH